MRKFLLKFHLEMYTFVVAVIILLGVLNVYEVTLVRKLLLIVLAIGVFHEWEEKRWPGGFFETVGTVWGWDVEKVDMRAPGQWVVYAWLVIVGIPLIFDDFEGLALAPIFLSVFEAVIHTAGRKITQTKGVYFPGIITAWIIGIAGVYCIVVLSQNNMITAIDCVVGIVFLVVVFISLQALIQKSAGSSIPEMLSTMKNRRKNNL